MSEKIKIACLPVAGKANPYQYLMMEGLNASDTINAFNGIDDRFLGIIKTYIKHKPNYIHFDWITSYYQRRKLWMTLLLLPIFIFQILYIRYFTKTKLVWTLHNIEPHDVVHKNLHQNIRKFFAKKTTWIRVFSDASIKRATNYLKISSQKFIVVPEGDYRTAYPNSISKKEARKKLQIDTSKFVMLSLGYIKPYKGLENLIDVFIKLNKEDAILLIAGKSINELYFKKLKHKIGKNTDRIKLVPKFIDENMLQVYYNATDVVILPFQKIENSGSVIMAMGFKKPIIAPKIGVIEKRLVNQKELLYESNNLSKSIHFIYKNRDKLNEYGEKNYTELDKYSWNDFNGFFA